MKLLQLATHADSADKSRAMMNIRIDDNHAYVELEVYGRYQVDRIPEALEAMRGLATRHGRFSVLEVQHGKPDNLFAVMKSMNRSDEATAYGFMSSLRKYALVSEDPPFLMRMAIMFSRSDKVKMRLFNMHERDQARQWVEEPLVS